MSILVYRQEQQEGPYDLEQIENALREGNLSPTDLAWQEGLADWVPLNLHLLLSPSLLFSVFLPPSLLVI